MTFQFGPVKLLTEVPSQFQKLYNEEAGEDGQFQIKSEFTGVTEALIGLNKALAAARADAKSKTPVDLSPLKEWGETPEAIAESFNARLDEASKGATGQARLDIEKIKADLSRANAGEVEKREKRIAALQGQLFRVLVENKAREAAQAMKGEPELLMPFIKDRVAVQEENGEFNVYVVDENKNVRYSGATGAPLGITELVSEMKADARYGRLFASEAPAGGGAPAGAGARPAVPQPGSSQLTATDKIKKGLQQGNFQKAGTGR